MVYKFVDKKLFLNKKSLVNSGSGIKSETISNKELTAELYKPTTKKLKIRKVYSSFIDNIWGADLANMQLISTFNKGILFLLCAIIFLVNMHGLFL